MPKLQPNSFLRAVLLEFNPPSLPFQPLFHCENLGSDLGPFLESGPAHPPNPLLVFCRNPNRGHSLPSLHPFTIQPNPLIPLLITFTTTLSEPWYLKSILTSPPTSRVLWGATNCWFAFSVALPATTLLFQTLCQLSSLTRLPCTFPPHPFLYSILYPLPLSLFSLSLHPWCENHRGLCQLVNTTLKKAE